MLDTSDSLKAPSKRAQCQRPDLLRWTFTRWSEIAGNQRAKKHFQRLVKHVRQSLAAGLTMNLNPGSFLLTGPSRSGKTALVKLLARCIVCQQLQADTLDPCGGQCNACSQNPELGGLEGIWSHLAASQLGHDIIVPVHMTIVDFTMINGREELKDKLWTLGSGCDGTTHGRALQAHA